MVFLEYRIDLSRLDVIELDNNNKINELNSMSEQRDSNSIVSPLDYSEKKL